MTVAFGLMVVVVVVTLMVVLISSSFLSSWLLAWVVHSWSIKAVWIHFAWAGYWLSLCVSLGGVYCCSAEVYGTEMSLGSVYGDLMMGMGTLGLWFLLYSWGAIIRVVVVLTSWWFLGVILVAVLAPGGELLILLLYCCVIAILHLFMFVLGPDDWDQVQ